MRKTDKSIKDQIIKLRQEGVSCPNISNITGVSRSTIMKLSKHIKLTEEQKSNIYREKSSWSNEEIKFLKQYYPEKGSRYCSSVISRSCKSISEKAFYLNLLSGANASLLKEKRIIQTLGENRALCKCEKHGTTIYYNPKTKTRQALRCMACSREYANIYNKTEKQRNLRREYNKERLKDPKHNFVARIRCHLNHCYHGKQVHFKELGYIGQELKDHLYKIKAQQNSCCPICNRGYNECKMTIEHIIPIATANSKQEIINLFALSNLSVMCINCNCSKQDNNFEEWKSKKLLERKILCP